MSTPHPKTRVDGRYKTLRIDLHNEIVELAMKGKLTIEADPCRPDVTMTLELHDNPVPLEVKRGLDFDCNDNVILPLVQCVIELRRQVEALPKRAPGA